MFASVRQVSCIGPFLICAASLWAAQTDRITEPINRLRLAPLPGGIHPRAKLQNDRGPAPASFRLGRLSLHLNPSEAQAAELRHLLNEQLSPSSFSYHRWLTPEAYADRFGVSPHDIDQLVAWLKSGGFQVTQAGRGRTWITFSGTARQVENFFHAPIHRYEVDGKSHFSNASPPSVPFALRAVIAHIGGMDDFLPRSAAIRASLFNTQSNEFHSLAPDDLAAIYDFASLISAGIDGTGQKIAIPGQAAVSASDIQSFRSKFNLSAPNLQTKLVPGLPAPAADKDALAEADLDIEWSGAVARNAAIIYVYSSNAFDALQYAIDQNLAPVISSSFGFCEAEGASDLISLQQLAQQAVAQGITWVNAAGDTGAASCDDNDSVIAQDGPVVQVPADIPEVTGVGGTEFAEGAGAAYWNSFNDANGASARGYIPEAVWNDVALTRTLRAGGGGASAYFSKPVWQTGLGVPADGARDVPDISLAASPDHDPFYITTGGQGVYYGGTSASAPVFAGMLALLNQYLVTSGALITPGLGNINPTLYWLAGNATTAFHDIAAGGNVVPCAAGSPGCGSGSFGYTAGTGYDLASGIGSPDAFNLLHRWTARPSAQFAEISASINPDPVTQQTADASGNQWTYTLTLREEGGVATSLTGFRIDGVDNSSQIATLFATASIPANGSVSAFLGDGALTVPANRVFALSGTDANGHQWTEELTAPFTGPVVTPVIGGIANAASGAQVFAPGMIVSVYGSSLSTASQGAAGIPLLTYMAGFLAEVNYEATPLYYVSPGQVNLQIPLDTPTGSQTLALTNGQDDAQQTLTLVAAAPGIFTTNASGSGQASALIAGTDSVAAPVGAFLNSRPVHPGEYISIYCTGLGAVSNPPALGEPAPVSPLATTTLTPVVTIGGIPATVSFSGLAPSYVGLYQLNVQIPGNAPAGNAIPLVVSSGSAISNAPTIAIQ